MYLREERWPYASGYYLILPDDTIYFKEGTPEKIKERFQKDWAAYLKERKEREANGIFID